MGLFVAVFFSCKTAAVEGKYAHYKYKEMCHDLVSAEHSVFLVIYILYSSYFRGLVCPAAIQVIIGFQWQ